VLSRLVAACTAAFGEARAVVVVPAEATLTQLRLCLDLLESAAFINADNQRYLAVLRVPWPAGGERKGGRGVREAPLANVLLELLLHVRGLVDEQVGLEVGEGPEDEGAAAVRRRLPDILLATLRVLVNHTHHSREAITHVVQVSSPFVWINRRVPHLCASRPRPIQKGTNPWLAVETQHPSTAHAPPSLPPQACGVETLLDCFLAHTSGSHVLEVLELGGEGLAPDPATLRERESFDVKLLALNALTNCAEWSAEARCVVAGLGVGHDGAGMHVRRVDEDRARLLPAVKYLVQYLLVRVRPFADQLAKVWGARGFVGV
jgi:hypothetical protein